MNASAPSHAASAHVLPDEFDVPVGEAATILEACLASEIPFAHACGGHAKCSTCRVVIIHGAENCMARNDSEAALASRLGFDDSVRLACQTRLAGPAVVRRLVLDDRDREMVVDAVTTGEIEAAGEEIVAAILFCDIRGFTAFSNRVLPYDVIHFLNRFYAVLGPEIAAHGGEINNTMGDGFLAIFKGIDERVACASALRAGIALLHAVERLRAYSEKAYGEAVRIGVGIHSGPVIYGAIGYDSSRRMTAIGDNVNVASRIEAATKELGVPLLVSPRVRDLLDQDWTWSEAGVVLLRGINQPIMLHAPAFRSAGAGGL